MKHVHKQGRYSRQVDGVRNRAIDNWKLRPVTSINVPDWRRVDKVRSTNNRGTVMANSFVASPFCFLFFLLHHINNSHITINSPRNLRKSIAPTNPFQVRSSLPPFCLRRVYQHSFQKHNTSINMLSRSFIARRAFVSAPIRSFQTAPVLRVGKESALRKFFPSFRSPMLHLEAFGSNQQRSAIFQASQANATTRRGGPR